MSTNNAPNSSNLFYAKKEWIHEACVMEISKDDHLVTVEIKTPDPFASDGTSTVVSKYTLSEAHFLYRFLKETFEK